MKKLEINQIENINSGGACAAVAVADVIVYGGGALSYFGLIAFTPVGAALMVGAGAVLGGASLYCAIA
jgi:hypothetical protein